MINKISIIGTGAVGSTLAFHILSGLSLKELALIDIAGDLALGVAFDLEDTRGLLGFETKINAGSDLALLKDSDIVVFTAGIARKPGMTRQDLFNTNAKIARDVSLKIKEYAPNSIVVAVSNPLDAITYVFTKETGFDRHRVLGMGASSDTSRLINLLSLETGVKADLIEAFIFGLHNANMIVSNERIKIKGQLVDKVLNNDTFEAISKRTKNRGTEIVGKLKTRSAYFTPSLACYFLLEAIVKDKSKIIPVAIELCGEYGLKDVCLAVPCLINKNGVERIVELKLTPKEQDQLEKVSDYYKEFVVTA